MSQSTLTIGSSSELALVTLRSHYAADTTSYDRTYGPADAEIDSLIFGMGQAELEAETTDVRAELKDKYAGEAHCLTDSSSYWTPYAAMRGIVRAMDLGSDDTLYDLGAGYGALPIYAGAVTEAKVVGVELTEHRVRAARAAIGRLGLTNVEMIEASVLDHDFGDGNAFYMFAPFNFPTFFAVLDKLGEVAETRAIKVVLRRMGGDWLNDGWLADAKKTKIKGTSGDLLLIEAGPK